MKRGALRRGLPVLLLVGMLVILVIAANSVAETYRLLSPLNQTGFPAYSTSSTVTFNFNLTASEYNLSLNLSNWSLYLGASDSWRINATNSSAWSNNTLFSFIVANVNDGTYNWTVGLNNGTITFVNNTNITLVVDTVKPNVTVIVPLAGNYSGNLLINASANDSLSSVNLTQYRFESPGYLSSWIAMPSHDPGFYNATNITTSLPDRRYNLSINATDNAGNQNASLNVTQITIDNKAPSVTGVFVNRTATSAGDVVASGILTVNATILDNGTGIANATFRYENSTANGTWTQMSRLGASDYYLGVIDVSGLAEGMYNFTINATDYMNFMNSTVKHVGLTVDRTPPSTYAVVGTISDSDLDGNIEMSWTDDATEVNETYIILRSTTGNISAGYNTSLSNITAYNRIAQGVQSFEDNTTTANNATAYWYAIMTVDALGHANFTANNTFIGVWPLNTTANDTRKPKIPMGLDCSASSSSTARLRWLSVYQDVAGNADEQGLTYRVYLNSTNISYDISLINLSYGSSGFSLLKPESSNSTTDSVTSSGVYKYIVTSVDDRSNENLTVNTSNYCSVSLTYTADDDGDGGGSSSGAGAGAAATATGAKVSHAWAVLGTGTTTMKISKAGIYFTELAFTTGNSANLVEVSVLALASKPSAFKDVASGRAVYQYLQVDKTNLPDSYVNRVVVKFKLEKKKLLDKNMSAGSVVLMRYNESGKQWTDLTTSLLDVADPIYYYYQSVSPGLSVFAIASKSAGETEAPIETPTVPEEETGGETVGNATGETPETKAPGKSHMKLYIIIALCVIVAAALGVGGYFLYKRRTGGFGGFGGLGGFFGRFRGLKVSRQPTMKMPSYKT
ncbi:MAG: PGF-pre-PGF domain-containing protein [Candidatus Woesearchaeota archaeon]